MCVWKGCGRGLNSRTGTILQTCVCVCVCVNVYLCVCVFLNICSSLALFSLLFMAHPCSGCWTPKLLCWKREEDRDKEIEHVCSHFSRVFEEFYLIVKRYSISWFLQAPVFFSPSLFSSFHFVFLRSSPSSPSVFLSWPCSLHPPPSRQQMLGSASRCFVFITLRSHL